MGRPLRAIYANTTYSNGVREMSDAEINDLVAPLILTYAINNPNTFFETTLRFDATPAGAANSVNRGTAYDINAGNIATHPASNTTISTYTLYQSELAQTFTGSRPVHYVSSGGAHQIAEMADSDIYTYLISPVVQTMIAGGQAGYYLGLTTTGAPVTGTWASVSTLTDTYYNSGSVLVSDGYTLWQRITGTTAGTIRPLKLSGISVIEMSNTDITNLSVSVSEYIRTTGVGTYALQASAPVTGTWVNRGLYTDTTNNLASANYTGYFAGTYVGYYTGSYTGGYTANYTTAFAGSYVGNYVTNYSGTYTGFYSTTYSGAYTGYYATSFTGTYTGSYTSAYSGTYVGNYSSNFVGYYTGYYGSAVGKVRTAYTPYTGAPLYYTGYYIRQYAGAYAGAYAGFFAGSYTGSYTRAYSGTYTGGYISSYTGVYTGGYVRAYTGTYGGSYASTYTGTYGGSYTGFFSGTYSGTYTTAWAGSYIGTYSSVFAGMTVQTTTNTTAYNLWVRTA